MNLDANTTVLIIEDSHTVRQGLRTMLSMAGITRSEAVTNAGEARNRLRGKNYDVVLCDYNLGDGMDGQELLEAMRKSGSLPLSTIWIMITGERHYERVVAAAEMAPDDYILKPFASQLLLDRMHLASQRKAFLSPAHKLLAAGRVEQSIQVLQQLAREAPNAQYRLDSQRLAAELLVNEGRQGEALSIYQELLTQKVIPWAKMGVARIIAEQGETQESNALLREIIADAPRYTDAYDLLAQNLIDDGQYQTAAVVLEKAVAISPRNFTRLKSCGTALLRCGNPAKAAEYLQRAVEVGRNNNFFGPDVLVDLLQAFSESDQTQQLDRLQAEIAARMDELSGGQLTMAVCRALAALAQKRPADAQSQLQAVADKLRARETDFSAVQRFLAAAVRLPPEQSNELPQQWAGTIAMRFADGRHELGTLLEISHKHEPCHQAIDTAYNLLQDSSNQAVELASNGQLEEAAEQLFQLSQQTLNERISMNACALLLRICESRNKAAQPHEEQLKQVGTLLAWLPEENERVRGFIRRREALDPVCE
ncbi:response regulator [Chromobacterium sp. IIBBL 290-4]|uniref:response regulator n=1 Tax=Chromobacterium sp. IIBBL 290-4 TaxID=2953890 RepID=UPI0020B67C4B|nr:response regulator [Chromobacterium sp. IIBBL 290-4]UTH75830.1 response regulator [Chromobacterium sp. IIBBL 290-4]